MEVSIGYLWPDGVTEDTAIISPPLMATPSTPLRNNIIRDFNTSTNYATPVWVASDNTHVQNFIAYRLNISQGMPAGWGQPVDPDSF